MNSDVSVLCSAHGFWLRELAGGLTEKCSDAYQAHGVFALTREHADFYNCTAVFDKCRINILLPCPSSRVDEFTGLFGSIESNDYYFYVSKLESISVINVNIQKQKVPSVEPRIEKILEIIKEIDYDPLLIPWGGRAKIKAMCLQFPRLFTTDTFDDAWSEGNKRELFSIKEKEKYKKTIA